MGLISQFGFGSIFALLLGALCAHFFPLLAKQLSRRRARQRFIQFVAPEGTGAAFKPSSVKEAREVGLLIHQVLMQQENDCEDISLEQLPRLGQKAPRCYEMTARVLALLDALSSCAWGCAKGDHVLERLVGRSVNHSRAALRLMLMGFYDEALALIRGVGEIANLLSLFAERSESFARWKSLDERMRRREFSPAKVRAGLDSIGTPIRVTDEVYGELSGRNVHANPGTSPQTYNILGIPKGGGHYQDAGLMICQNELAQSLAFVIYGAAKLSHVDQRLKKRMFWAGHDLALHTGGLNVANVDEMWADLTSKAAADPPEQNPPPIP